MAQRALRFILPPEPIKTFVVARICLPNLAKSQSLSPQSRANGCQFAALTQHIER
jgi:hypothetical protein